MPTRTAKESVVAAGYSIVVAAAVLLLTAVLAGDAADHRTATALCSVGVALIAIVLFMRLAPYRLIGAVGLAGGLALTFSALLTDAWQAPEVGRLVGGAILFLASAGILAATTAGRDRGGPV